FHMLRPDTDTDEARTHSAQYRRTFQQPHDPREASWSRDIKTSTDLLSDQCLHASRDPRRKRAAALYLGEIADADGAVAKGFCQYISGRDRILDGKIDPDTAHRRHGVGRISDAQQAGAIPVPQSIDSDGQELHIVPVM